MSEDLNETIVHELLRPPEKSFFLQRSFARRFETGRDDVFRTSIFGVLQGLRIRSKPGNVVNAVKGIDKSLPLIS